MRQILYQVDPETGYQTSTYVFLDNDTDVTRVNIDQTTPGGCNGDVVLTVEEIRDIYLELCDQGYIISPNHQCNCGKGKQRGDNHDHPSD